MPAATTTDDNAARIALANSHFDAGRYTEARTLYQEALQRAPRNLAVSTDLAVCHYQLGEMTLALKQVDYSLSLEPSNTKALFNKGLFLAYGMNDWPGARNLFRRVISIAPQSTEAVQARKVLDAAGPR
jgi:tetratricopeptide (TPR) repeat protein